MASAGRMRPNTTSSGNFTTPRTNPVSTMTFNMTLVKSPKNAFQSPGTHNFTGALIVVLLNSTSLRTAVFVRFVSLL